MESYPNYPINDQIPSSQLLKNKVLAQMKARNDNYFSNRSSLSQYIQDAEEKQRTNTAKQFSLLESQKPLNKAASSKVAANAMKNIVEPGIDAAMLIEGGGLAKNAIKSGLKSMSKKAVVNGKTRISSAEAEKIMADLQSDFLILRIEY
jgi:2',3'-cyclic-nucleotide 2'-phosphodiesterase (5'-nucleotidase family)